MVAQDHSIRRMRGMRIAFQDATICLHACVTIPLYRREMALVRRLLVVLLAVALMQFSVAATAPAHAHETESVHAVHTLDVALDDHAHGHEDADADHHDDRAVLSDKLDSDRNQINGSHHESMAHVHACPQFITVDMEHPESSPTWAPSSTWRLADTDTVIDVAVSLDRPPRVAL